MLGQEFIALFTGMNWICGILLMLGIAFGIIEFFTPGLGVSGFLGIICILSGVIARWVSGASFIQILIMIFILLAFFTLLFLVFVRSAKYGLINRSPIVEMGTAISQDFGDENHNPLADLKNKVGTTSTHLKPIGKVEIEGVAYDAKCEGGYIDAGVLVKVVSVEGNELKVQKVYK